MIIGKLRAKNQLSIPSEIVKKLHLRVNDLFAIGIENNYIKLMPVEIEPRYTSEELKTIDKIVNLEKSRAKVLKVGKEFSDYIGKIT